MRVNKTFTDQHHIIRLNVLQGLKSGVTAACWIRSEAWWPVTCPRQHDLGWTSVCCRQRGAAMGLWTQSGPTEDQC